MTARKPSCRRERGLSVGTKFILWLLTSLWPNLNHWSPSHHPTTALIFAKVKELNTKLSVYFAVLQILKATSSYKQQSVCVYTRSPLVQWAPSSFITTGHYGSDRLHPCFFLPSSSSSLYLTSFFFFFFSWTTAFVGLICLLLLVHSLHRFEHRAPISQADFHGGRVFLLDDIAQFYHQLFSEGEWDLEIASHVQLDVAVVFLGGITNGGLVTVASAL